MENQKIHSLLDIIVVFIISTSIVSISSLLLNVFKVHISIILSLLFTLSIFYIRSSMWTIDLNLKKNTHTLYILILLLIGLLFRVEPYHYIAGGQDEGVYVNMSQYFEKYGKIFITDDVRNNLTEDLKNAYDSANLKINIRVEDQYEGSYLPGVYLKDQQNSEYVFQFYHLHPLWMSIFGKLFGDENRIYSLVFFSLLSIIAFYLLAFEFTKNQYLAFFAGALLAINPLHAFFSKFPVTEIVALTFSTLSFYYLLKYYNLTREKLYFPVYLVLSSLLMCGMFFTRISGFMYIPFFYMILILVQIYILDKTVKNHIKVYIFSVFLLYAISVWYGMVFSFPYSHDIYNISFSKVFGSKWQEGLVLLLGLLVVFYLLLLYPCRKICRDKLKQYLSKFRGLIPYLFLIVIGLGFYKVYQLGYTEKYLEHQWYNLRWKAAGKEWIAFLYWSVFVVVEYLSPFLIIVFSYILFSQTKTNDVQRTILILFILLFFIHISLLQWFIPYQYYYARYLLSEALPFILLFTIIGLNRITKYKYVSYTLIGFSAIYMLFFTTMQFKGKEMHGFHTSLSQLKKYIGPDDILILDKRILHTVGEIKTSLKFYYDYNVLSVKNNKDKKRFIDFFCNKNKNVYLFNSNSWNEFAEPIKFIPVKAEIFVHRPHIPMNIHRGKKQYLLSKARCNSYIIYNKGFTHGERINFHNNTWTKKVSNLTNIGIVVDNNKFLVLETFGYNPFRNFKKLNLKISVNGHNLIFVKQEKNKYYFTLPDIHKVLDMEIASNTFIPKEFGINQDERVLGIDIKSIQLSKEINQ